jgi:Ca2+-binding EF-hand superfamily protein
MFANPDFNVQKLYNMIDVKNQGFFNFDEFKNFFKELNINSVNNDYLLGLFTGFDSSKRYTLSLQDLENMVYPNDRRIVREGVLNQRQFYRLTLNDVRDMFTKHLKLKQVID